MNVDMQGICCIVTSALSPLHCHLCLHYRLAPSSNSVTSALSPTSIPLSRSVISQCHLCTVTSALLPLHCHLHLHHRLALSSRTVTSALSTTSIPLSRTVIFALSPLYCHLPLYHYLAPSPLHCHLPLHHHLHHYLLPSPLHPHLGSLTSAIRQRSYTMPRVSYKKRLLEWYFKTLEVMNDEAVYEDSIEMLIDIVEEEEELALLSLLGDEDDEEMQDCLDDTEMQDCLDDEEMQLDYYLDSESSSTTSTVSSLSTSSASSSSLNDLNDDLEDIIFEGIAFLQAHRYLIDRNRGIPKDMRFYHEVLPALPEDRFLQYFRMGRDAFIHIYEKIANNDIFTNNSRNPQVPISLQLAVTLRRLACESSTSSSCINIGQSFGISEGAVTLYTQRVVKAITDLWATEIKWPNIQERAAMKARLMEDPNEHGWKLWRDCIGIVDGTLIPFKGRTQSLPILILLTYYN